MKLQPCFFTKSVKFGFGELSICRICAESRDLGPEHGFRACSLKKDSKIREQIGFSYFWGFKTQTTKKQKQWKNNVATFIFSWKFSFFLLFSKEQALKPCPDCRSRDSAQIRQIESSPNPNLTDLVKKEGWYFVKTVLAVTILISAGAAVGNAPLWEFKFPQFLIWQGHHFKTAGQVFNSGN